MSKGTLDEETMGADATAQHRPKLAAVTAARPGAGESGAASASGRGARAPALDPLRRRADPRPAGARARDRPRPGCCSTSPPATSTSPRWSGWRETWSSSTRPWSWSPTTAGSSRRWHSAGDGGRARPFLAGPWHAWRQEQAARQNAPARQSSASRWRSSGRRDSSSASLQGDEGETGAVGIKKIDKTKSDGPRPSAAAPAPALLRQCAGATRPDRANVVNGRIEVAGRVWPAELEVERGEHVVLVGANGAARRP